MTTYTATIRHHSVLSAHTILIDGTLTKAKQRAMAEFGDGFSDHEIIILDNANGEVIARRRIGSRGWTNA